ncbi:MAG: MBL fold metallo-hydrolase [Clostridia bacterium]|nr:MBL fold metallo-hydrolase [Clostridia bacterium]
MNGTKIYTLYSSSKGNSVYIEAPDVRILIDAGGSMRSLTNAMCAVGGALSKLDAVFVTHAHSDHTGSLVMLMKKHHIPVHMTDDCAREFRDRCAPICDTVTVHPRHYTEAVGSLTLCSFVTPHDSAGSVGYVVKGSDFCLGLATDMGFVTEEIFRSLCGCDRVIVESNYDRDMLVYGSDPPVLKARISSRTGHLSNDDCAQLVTALAGRGVKNFMLAHLSERNNTPETALRTSCAALQKGGHADGCSILCAAPDRPTLFD